MHTKYRSFGSCGVREEEFSCISHHKPMADNNAPGGVACMDPRSTVGMIYKEEHYRLQHTKYESYGPCGFIEEDFYVFPV